VTVVINDLVVADRGIVSIAYLAGETKVFDLGFTVPNEAAIGVGVDSVAGVLNDPLGNLLGSATLALTVLAGPLLASIGNWRVKPRGGIFTVLTVGEILAWNSEVVFRFSVYNESDYDIVYYTEVRLIDPGGVNTLIGGGTKVAITTMGSQDTETIYVTLGLEGVYTIKVIASAQRYNTTDPFVVVATGQIQFEVVAPIVYGGDILV